MATDAAKDPLFFPGSFLRPVIGHGSTAKVYFLAPSALILNNFRLVISFFSSTLLLEERKQLGVGSTRNHFNH